MNNNERRISGILAGILLIPMVILLTAQARRQILPAQGDSANSEKILKFIREKFGILDTVKLSAEPFRSSSLPGFYESRVNIDDGKQSHSQNILVSTDNRYLIVGEIYPLGGRSNEIAQRVREKFKLPPTTGIRVESYRGSTFPNFLEAPVSVSDGKKNQSQTFYVTKDLRYFVLGSIFPVQANVRREVLRRISTEDQPSQGSASAPVTIVEYADLQCPQCARFHQFLEKDLISRYGDKIRIVFKEFPLVGVHDWTLSAATAAQCAYEINPSTFVPYRTLIFEHQASINATNVRDLLLSYGEQVGINRVALGGCLDSKASLPRVQENLREGQAVGVNSTPTSFINGRIVVGAPSPEVFYSIVDEALRGGK